MPYRYLEDEVLADIAVEATGPTLEETFIAAADATMNTMIDDLSSIRQRERRDIHVEDEELEMALFNFLQEILFFKDAEGLLLRVDSLEIRQDPAGYRLDARASGEHLSARRHAQLADVKAVTLHRFQIARSERGWMCRFVLDV